MKPFKLPTIEYHELVSSVGINIYCEVPLCVEPSTSIVLIENWRGRSYQKGWDYCHYHRDRFKLSGVVLDKLIEGLV